MNTLPHKHIHEKFRHIATMSNEERIKFIDTPRWFGYDKANRVIENMQGLMNMVQQHRMPNLLIIGDSNNGKTTIIKQFVKRFGDSYIDDDLNLVIPVISIQDAHPTGKLYAAHPRTPRNPENPQTLHRRTDQPPCGRMGGR